MKENITSVIKKKNKERIMNNNPKFWSMIAVLLSILIAIVSASIDVGQEKQKIDSLEERQLVVSINIKNNELKIAQQELALTKMQKDIDYMTKTLEEIKSDVKEINKKTG